MKHNRRKLFAFLGCAALAPLVPFAKLLPKQEKSQKRPDGYIENGPRAGDIAYWGDDGTITFSSSKSGRLAGVWTVSGELQTRGQCSFLRVKRSDV